MLGCVASGVNLEEQLSVGSDALPGKMKTLRSLRSYRSNQPVDVIGYNSRPASALRATFITLFFKRRSPAK